MNLRDQLLVVSLFSILWTEAALSATEEFTPPSLPNGCALPGDTLSYTCTVVGGVTTIWSGSAFECTGNRATLLNIEFGTPAAIDACGPLTATGVSIDNTGADPCYTSELSVPITTSLNGRTVMCSRDASVVIGSPHTLSVAGAAASFPSPSTIGVSPGTFTFSWTPITVNCSLVTGYTVDADMTDCGTCDLDVNSNNTATCTGWIPIGQVCTVSVMSVVSGGIAGDPATLNLTLQEPDAPSVSVTLLYLVPSGALQFESGALQSIQVSFPVVSPVVIVPGSAGSPGLVPNVTYFAQLGNQSSQNISNSSCNEETCTQTFTTNLPTENQFNISVSASNGLGNGSPSSPVMVSSSLTLSVRVEGTTVTVMVQGSGQMADLVVKYYRTGEEPQESTGEGLTATLPSQQPPGQPPLEPVSLYNYIATVMHNDVEVKLQGTFNTSCSLEGLGRVDVDADSQCMMISGFDGGVRDGVGLACYSGINPGDAFAQLLCNGTSVSDSLPRRECQSDGTWSNPEGRCPALSSSSTLPPYVIPVIVVVCVIFLFAIGIIIGILCAIMCYLMVDGLREGKCSYIILVVILSILFGFGIGIAIGYCCVKNKKGPKSKASEKRGLTQSTSNPEGPGLYADPNTIERETAPGTTDQYALVDVKTKKNKTPKPTQPEALYQDPNKIEHETAPGGDMYAVVDKPRGASKKKKEPDVVPPGTEGLTYADIDVTASRSRPRQASQRQAQEPVGSVEYSDVKFKEDGSRL